jgi:SAM-dependent methyltransferase
MRGDEIEIGNIISTTSNVEIDLTQGTDYHRLIDEEVEHYSHIEVTDKLTEGGVASHKSWAFYYDYLDKKVFGRGFDDEIVFQAEQFEHPRLLSLGCGYGGIDLEIARKLRNPFELVAVDLNPRIYIEAERRAKSEGLNMHFKSFDLNFIDIQPEVFDIIYAHASLHHVLNLEHLFSKLYHGLTENGRFVVRDIIGKTQVLFWKENVEFTVSLIKKMPKRYRPPVGKRLWKHFWFDPYTIIPKYKEPSKQVRMEGIRQEEIESLVAQWFSPVKLFKYNAYMRMICTNVYLGARLDPDKDVDREYLEELIKLELQQIEKGNLRPTEIFGVFKKKT